MIKKRLQKLMLTSFLLAGVTGVDAQNLEWAKAIISSNQTTTVSSTAADGSGNVYLTGSFFGGAADFDPGVGVHNLTPVGYDIFVLKLSATGDFVWVKQFKGQHQDGGGEPTDISVDSLGNAVICGYFGSFDGNPYSVDFDPGAGIYNLTNTSPNYNYDGFVVKLDASGALAWANKIGDDGEDNCSSVSLDNHGSVLVTGYFQGTLDFNPGTGINNITAADKDVFVAKYRNDGTYVWVKNLGTRTAKSIKTDADRNVYTLGTFGGTVDFDPGAGIQNLTTGTTSQGWTVENIYISKLDSNGTYVWAKNMGDPMGELTSFIQPMALSLDSNANIYIAGIFSDTTDLNPSADTAYVYSQGLEDIFITKLNKNGHFLWAKSIGSFSYESVFDMEVDQIGNSYTIGHFRVPLDFDPSDTGSHVLIPANQYGAIYLSKWDSTGNFVWVANINNTDQGSLGLNGMRMALNPFDNSIYYVSNFSDTIDFDPGPGVVELPGVGEDCFVLKFNNCSPSNDTITITACNSFTLYDSTYTLSGTYLKHVVNAQGCEDIVTLQLTITHSPSIAVTQAGNVLSANATGATYQWIDCNNGNAPIVGASQQIYTAASNGSYAVVVTKDGCSDTSICYSVTGTSIHDVVNNRQITIYPNPVKGTLTILTNTAMHNANIRLINVVGQTVLTQTNNNGNKLQLDLSKYPSGTYVLEVGLQEGIARFKIVKD